MFMGEFRPSIDEKGRVAIPARLRRAFGDSFPIQNLVLAPGFDRCVMAFREDDWRQFVETKLAPVSQSDPDHRKRMRFLLGGAHVCELDRQGRVLVPSPLVTYASLERDTVIIGMYDRIEIWNAAAFDSYRPSGDTLEEFARELGL